MGGPGARAPTRCSPLWKPEVDVAAGQERYLDVGLPSLREDGNICAGKNALQA
jgi:hypothetical protein